MSDIAAQALAIANLKARYCRAADTAAEDIVAARGMLADVFTADFVGDYGYGLLHGPAAITDFLCDAIAGGSVWMIHMLHSPRIEINGDGATGDWIVTAQSKRRETGEISIVLGRYADVFRYGEDGWRIARITFSRPV
ncbi:nuclear transport factor 2 family protein [Sphingomonas sp. OK281]|uniref:nuclear transport factor 2 family protein n=1 Tax=Sphingomonas sp. OK281 TaxID=1881067 RepID=UPI0008EBD40F|nr:nuclear transport factor 2 family protein [Sphingomonas sp. OK281]SFO35233.1 SnoaL-like domain-containing protein [Sphingomonas sp. OK281]